MLLRYNSFSKLWRFPYNIVTIVVPKIHKLFCHVRRLTNHAHPAQCTWLRVLFCLQLASGETENVHRIEAHTSSEKQPSSKTVQRGESVSMKEEAISSSGNPLLVQKSSSSPPTPTPAARYGPIFSLLGHAYNYRYTHIYMRI